MGALAVCKSKHMPVRLDFKSMAIHQTPDKLMCCEDTQAGWSLSLSAKGLEIECVSYGRVPRRHVYPSWSFDETYLDGQIINSVSFDG